MTKNDVNSSQFEILQHDTIKYSRKGGYFVTTKKALVYLVLTLTFSSTVGYLVYKYGPNRNQGAVVTKKENIQDLLDKSIRNIPIQNLKLPKTLEPLHYKLRLRPEMENLTFSGEVSIIIQANEKTKYIVLNADQLQLNNITINQIQDKQNRKRRSVNETVLSNVKQSTYANENSSETSPIQDMYNEYYPMETIAKNDSNLTAATKILPTGTTTIQKSLTKRNDVYNITTTPVASTEVTTQSRIEKVNTRREVDIHSTPVLDTISVLSKQINGVSFQYSMHLSKPLRANQTYILTISFSGKISDSLRGLHHNSYTDNQNKTKYIIASHFQPIFARRVFPCFDEPEMKATFDISIVRKENMNSLSNMRLKRTYNLSNGFLEDQFETTPPIPTFQVAVILLNSDYYSSTNEVSNISIWAPEEHLKYASYPLGKAGKIMDYYNEYFDLKYTLPKLDIVTIPTLPSTATENWGLIFFKESALLNGEDEREIFSFLAKKLAQQWLGNLVTVNWWDDLWLVKGFALLVADEAGVKINQWMSEFTLTITQNILALDDYKSASSLKINIINTLQINELFDSVTHQKGSCLLRMLESSMPENLFKRNVQNFLKQWKLKIVNRNDFWTSINNQTEEYLPNGKNVSDIMETWISQRGYPLITVIRDNNSMNITQSKFQASNKSDNNLWIVPLNYMIGSGGERKLWLTNRSITVTNVSGAEWILFNVKRTGYYRVNYDKKNWKQLIEVLNENHVLIPIENRGQLINDAFKLAENGLLDYQIPFNLTKYLQGETNYIPWASVLNSLEFLKQILQSTYLNGAYEEYIRTLVSNLYDEMQNNTSDNQRLRRLIIETACSVNYQPCINWAKSRFSDWMQDTIPVPYDMRKTIFCSAIRTGGNKEWDFLWNQIKSQKSNSDIEELFMSLGCSRDTWLINKYMRNALSGEIPWQYVPHVWKSLSQPTSLAFGFKYLRENWDTIYQAYKDKPIILKAIVQDFLYALSSKSDLEDLTLLVSSHEKDLQELAGFIQGAVDRIKVRVEWSTKHLYQVEQLLSNELEEMKKR